MHHDSRGKVAEFVYPVEHWMLGWSRNPKMFQGRYNAYHLEHPIKSVTSSSSME